MTESEWLVCDSLLGLRGFLKGRASDRKLRLFAVACCRRIWHLLPDQHSRQTVALCERVAEGLAAVSDLEDPRMAATRTAGRLLHAAAWAPVWTADDRAT